MPYEKLIRYLNHDVEGSIDPDIYRAIESTVKRTPSGKRLDPSDLRTLLTINRDHVLFRAEPRNAGYLLRAVDFKLTIIPEGTPQQEAVGDLLIFLDKHDGRHHIRQCNICRKWYAQRRVGGQTCSDPCSYKLSKARKMVEMGEGEYREMQREAVRRSRAKGKDEKREGRDAG